MTDSPPEQSADVGDPGREDPRDRIWELELLISGAVTLGLLQLPGRVDTLYQSLGARVSTEGATALLLGYEFAKIILYLLIASFVLHLVARAYWVALIGLHAIFPGGIRWGELRYGPNLTDLYRRNTPALPAAIERANRFCSVIFAFAAMMVWSLGIALVFAAVAGIVAIAASALLPVATMTAFWTAFFGLFAVTSLLVIIDKAVGGKLDPHSGPGRLLRVALHRSYPIRLYRGFLVTNLVLFSNISKRTMYPVFYTVLIGLFAFFVVNDLLLPAGVLRFGGYEYLPERADQRSVEDRYYRDQREEDEVFAVTPSIQSDVVSGPYLKLFVPHYPQRHNDLFAARCRGVRPLTSGGTRFSLSRDSVPDATVQALFDCWSRIQPVTLNGEPIRPEWFLYTQPESGIRGKLAYIPTAAMAAGMNLLTVGRLPRRRSPEEARQPYTIRFWR